LTCHLGQNLRLIDHNGVVKYVNVDQHFIDLLPMAAETLRVAREWETVAFTSIYGTRTRGDDAHQHELQLAELLASIDFINNPNVILEEIRRKKDEKSLKKYLKYKKKYLDLKKQLNLL
jgi:hypothetical protein